METKACRKCRQVKNLSDFYTHKKMLDGHLNICKVCVKERVTAYRQDNIEDIKRYDRERGRTPERKSKLLARQHKQKNDDPDKWREYRKDVTKKSRNAHPGHQNARTKVARALLRGDLTKPSKCEKCGVETPKLDAHHPDYSKPLSVMWLCKQCHGEQHRLEDSQPESF